jgi:hypothetical protein
MAFKTNFSREVCVLPTLVLVSWSSDFFAFQLQP